MRNDVLGHMSPRSWTIRRATPARDYRRRLHSAEGHGRLQYVEPIRQFPIFSRVLQAFSHLAQSRQIQVNRLRHSHSNRTLGSCWTRRVVCAKNGSRAHVPPSEISPHARGSAWAPSGLRRLPPVCDRPQSTGHISSRTSRSPSENGGTCPAVGTISG